MATATPDENAQYGSAVTVTPYWRALVCPRG